MNFEPFYQRCKSMPETEQRWAEAFIATLDGLFDDEQFQSMEKVCALFYGKGAGLSKTQYYRKRKFIVEFYKWLHEEGKITEKFLDEVIALKLDDVISEEELNKYYFESLNSAIGFINTVGARFGFTEPVDLLNIKVIVILSWHLIDVPEMITIKKDDLDSKNQSIHIRGTKSREVFLDAESFDYLKLFANSDVYKGFPTQKIQIYQTSRFLLRSARQDRLSVNNVACCLRRFNNEAQAFGRAFNLIALKKNGLFCRVIEKDTDEMSINSLIEQLIQCEKSMAYGYTRFYKRWKKRYYSNQCV